MKFILLITTLLFVVTCNKKDNNQTETDNKPPVSSPINSYIDQPEWSIRSFIAPNDSNYVLRITYTDEMGLVNKAYFCKVVFENKKTREYKLVAPWIDNAIILQKTNILSDRIDKIHKDSMKIAMD